VNDRPDIIGHLRKVTDRPMLTRGLVELVLNAGVGAKVKTTKSGDTVITIPRKG
jgi:hypothetical protein